MAYSGRDGYWEFFFEDLGTAARSHLFLSLLPHRSVLEMSYLL